MSKLTRREVILAKIEVTYNTDPVPVAGTDAVLVESPSWAYEGLRMNERPVVRNTLGTLKHVYGGALKTVTFDVEFKGSGTIDVPPEMGVLLRACGWGETINVSTSVVYDPVSTSTESITIYYFQDGIRHILTGCRGNVSFNWEAGAIAKASFTITGHFSAETDVAVPTPTYDSTVPPPVIGGAFAIGGFSAIVGTLAWDMTNALALPPDISASDGYAEVQITGRDPNGTFNPELPTIAAHDFFTELRNGTALALASGVFGSTAGNRFQVSMPAVSYREQSPQDADGIRTLENGFGAAEVSGDDDVTITFT